MPHAAAESRGPGEIVACSDCGARQRILDAVGVDALCWRCSRALEHGAGRSAGAALACAAAAFLLLIPGNLAPVMRSHLLGTSIEARAIDGAVAFWADGWPLMAGLVFLFVIAIPVARSVMLTVVLGSLRLGQSRRWQGPVFRHAEALRPWSMLVVYLLAGIVTYSRIAAQLEVEVLFGGWCLAAAALLLLIGEASLNRRRVWDEIHPGARVLPGQATLGCDACHLVVPKTMEGAPCPRCGRRLHARLPDSLRRTAAVTVGALVLYPPALFLPMTRTVQPGGIVERNILDGVSELFTRGFWYLGILVFTASITIPLVKLVGLGWMMFRVRYPRAKGLVLRTRLHRGIDEINRWSFVDPFIVALTAPLMAYPGIADVHAGPGALPFALVIVLTMLGSRWFDSRLMWDAAEKTHD